MEKNICPLLSGESVSDPPAADRRVISGTDRTIIEKWESLQQACVLRRSRRFAVDNSSSNVGFHRSIVAITALIFYIPWAKTFIYLLWMERISLSSTARYNWSDDVNEKGFNVCSFHPLLDKWLSLGSAKEESSEWKVRRCFRNPVEAFRFLGWWSCPVLDASEKQSQVVSMIT